MVKLKTEHEEVVALLDSVPGVIEHNSSIPVLIGNYILSLRMDAGLDKSEVVYLMEDDMTVVKLSKIENGEVSITVGTYLKILNNI